MLMTVSVRRVHNTRRYPRLVVEINTLGVTGHKKLGSNKRTAEGLKYSSQADPETHATDMSKQYSRGSTIWASY